VVPSGDRWEGRHAARPEDPAVRRFLTGPEHAVVEPATGDTLGTVILASEPDVAVAADAAHTARRAWAKSPHTVRAAVLRRAGDLFAAHAAELRDWIVRESGSVPGKAGFARTGDRRHPAAQDPRPGRGRHRPRGEARGGRNAP
jgi:acyl-CoA reductase-like NAD-dependent aldehyde dehydrogenase